MRRQLEGLVVERLAGGLGTAQAKRLRAHVGAERQLLGRDGPESIRLAGEFHMLLAELTGNALLARYVAEVVSRSSLILALYSRPHSSECGANEHAGILKALIDGDGARARHLMDHHLGLVQDRALLPKDDGAKPEPQGPALALCEPKPHLQQNAGRRRRRLTRGEPQ